MSMRKKKAEEVSEGAPEWIVTYADLVTLLLTFFILLFSMAIIDKQKFEEVAFSLRSAFTHISSGEMFNENQGNTMISLTPFNEGSKLIENETKEDEAEQSASTEKNIEDVKAAKLDIEKLIEEMGLNENIKLIEEKDEIILRVDSLILFDSGNADLKASGMPVLEKIGLIMKNLKTDIFVQGHADDRPISTVVFPSNWELSTRRATNVVKYLVEKSDMEQKYLTATGNAEFKPIAPNDSEYNRQKNRRIDIVIAK